VTGDPAGALDPYVPSVRVDSLDDCYFYHTVDLPGLGLVEGDWDLRGRESTYLGGVELAGRRVLEIGPASGHLTWFMERAGAEVVALDLSSGAEFDVVPYATGSHEHLRTELDTHVRQAANAFWLTHRLTGLSARRVHGTAYDVPAGIGSFDLVTLCSVLLHLRDPFRALEAALSRVRDTVVVTDRAGGGLSQLPLRLGARLGRAMFFRPDAATLDPPLTWWRLTPQVVQAMIAVLGFGESRVTHHRQLYRGQSRWLFTVVGRRTAGGRSLGSGG
jgi:SAM-dependent methyltransferase